jgi:hypothetical protein
LARPADKKEIEQFLARQLPYVRAYLEGGQITNELGWALTKKEDTETLFKANEEYVEILRRHPEELKKYRRRQAKAGAESTLFGVPSLPLGARRKDALAQEATELQRAGKSYAQIAKILNYKHGLGITNREAIRSLIRSRKTARRRRKPAQ